MATTIPEIIDGQLDTIAEALKQAKLVKQLAEDVIESQGNCSTHPDSDDVWVDRETLHKLADAIGYKKSTRGAK